VAGINVQVDTAGGATITGKVVYAPADNTKFRNSLSYFLKSRGIDPTTLTNQQAADQVAIELGKVMRRAANEQRAAEEKDNVEAAVEGDVGFDPEPQP
jgi:hypothetical protein